MKTFITIIISLLCFSNTLFSEIIYTDIDPDKELYANEGEAPRFQVDLNDDGQVDFYFKHFNMGPSWNHIEAYTMVGQPGEILVHDGGEPVALSKDELISNNSGNWHCSATQSSSSAMFMRESWLGQGEKYMALRFKINNNWHYAWIRIMVEEDKSGFIIYDYAYETEANKEIHAGETENTSVGNNNDFVEMKVINNSILLNSEQNSEIEVNVYNLLGNLVYKANSYTNQKLELKLQSGVYFIMIKQKNKVVYKKLIL